MYNSSLLLYNPFVNEVKVSNRERSESTRRKITAAASVEFIDKGYHGATMASIAKRAGVALQTVYFVFHNKAALMSAVIDSAVMGDDDPTIPQQSRWWAAAFEEPDAAESLRIFIRGASPLFARASAISEILRAAALTDAEVELTYAHHERLRLEAFREVIEMVASKGNLRRNLDIATATDIFLTMYGDSTYYLMTTERGWSHERFVDWLCEALPVLLLQPRAG